MKVWGVPYKASSDMVYLLCESASDDDYDELCRRVWNFIVACNTSACSLVRGVVYYGIHFGRMKSVIGQNAWFLCEVLCRSLSDMYTRKLSAGVLCQRSVSALKPDTARRVESMIEIILLRSGLLHYKVLSY